MTQIDVAKVITHAVVGPPIRIDVAKLITHAVVGPPVVIDVSKVVVQAVVAPAEEITVSKVVVQVVMDLSLIEVSKVVPKVVVGFHADKSYVSKVVAHAIMTPPDVFTCLPHYLTQEHIDDAQLLTADGVVDLFEFTLTDETQLFLKANNAVTWQGNTYEATAIQLDGVANYSDAETARPKLTVANPEGVFSAIVASGVLDNANVVRRRVLYQNMLLDVPISETQTWRVRRIVSMNREKIVMELRDRTDSQFFLTPGRMFIPPDFPQVSLS